MNKPIFLWFEANLKIEVKFFIVKQQDGVGTRMERRCHRALGDNICIFHPIVLNIQ